MSCVETKGNNQSQDLAGVSAETAGEAPDLVAGLNDREECAEGMSNFDHTVDAGFEDKLRTGEFWGRHAAWDFNGKVWFANGQFHEQVWVYGSPRKIISAATLEDLMSDVNAEFGSA